MDPVLAAGVAHLWFLTVHPFEDGNGRIARAIADMALARSEKSPERFYSMSAQIGLERGAYYDILEATQKGGLDITAWQVWFLECLGRAIGNARNTLTAVLAKAAFWEAYASDVFNRRQLKTLNRLLDGFEGKLTSSKWARMNRCSQDTANRDIGDLVERGILVRGPAGGRSTQLRTGSAPHLSGCGEADGNPTATPRPVPPSRLWRPPGDPSPRQSHGLVLDARLVRGDRLDFGRQFERDRDWNAAGSGDSFDREALAERGKHYEARTGGSSHRVAAYRAAATACARMNDDR